MSLLGRLLRNRHAGEEHVAWNLPNLAGPDLLTVTSRSFADGGTMPPETRGKLIGGQNRSPDLEWSSLPPGTAQLLLVVEDIDVPQAKPAVHCVAVIDPSAGRLEPGALAAKNPGPGVRLLRSVIGRGYQGPSPIKGHGPHRYVFQLFALDGPVAGAEGARPRTFLPTVAPAVLGRGRLTGVVER